MPENLDKVLARAKIRFFYNLTLDQAQGLLEYIAIHLPVEINRKSIQFSQLYNTDPGKYREVEVESGIMADIFHRFENKAHSSFFVEPSEGKEYLLSHIMFKTEDNWGLEQYSPEVVQLWDDVRKVVHQYFADNPE